MNVLLMVDRDNLSKRICVMAWTAGDDNPRLLEAGQFMGEAALEVWLAGIATRYGRRNIHLDWTEALRGDARLATVLEHAVDALD